MVELKQLYQERIGNLRLNFILWWYNLNKWPWEWKFKRSGGGRIMAKSRAKESHSRGPWSQSDGG